MTNIAVIALLLGGFVFGFILAKITARLDADIDLPNGPPRPDDYIPVEFPPTQ